MIYLDLETYSEVPIAVGTYRYCANAEVMLIAYAIDDGPVQCVDLTNPAQAQGSAMQAFYDAVTARAPVHSLTAHNAMFDRNALRLGNLKLNIPIERWRCTMAQALAHSLPGALEKLGQVFRIAEDEKKIKDGKRLVQLFCKPMPKTSKLRRATRSTHPQEWARFIEYAKADVAAMRAIHKKMPDWNYSADELALWHLDQRINDRGMRIDLPFVEAAIRAVEREQKRLAQETLERTSGEVSSATQRDKLLEHVLSQYGVDLPDMTASTLERRISDPDLPQELRELLAIRLQASTSSTSKYGALKRAVSEDGRLRGTIQFCGASRTGRDAGRVFQPQNLPRPAHSFEEVEYFIGAALADAADILFPGEVMARASSSIRSAIIASEGKKLFVSDLSNIEGRMAAWLAGEEWKLEAFRDFDAGRGEDLYKVSYGRAFKIDPKKVNKAQRQVGKVLELMLQYEGGVGAFVTGAAGYSIDLDELAEVAWPSLPGDVVHEAEGFYNWVVKEKRPDFGLSRKAFVVCDALKRLWRRAHPAIVTLWDELADAWRTACLEPGNTVECRRVSFRVDGLWLRIILPSGRALCYPSPRVGSNGECSYMGVNQYTRKWQRIKTYGGKLLENITQAASRDVFKHGIVRAEGEGFEVVLPVHDEIVAEGVWGRSIDDLIEAMREVPSWAPGLPLAAAGFTTTRYRKED